MNNADRIREMSDEKLAMFLRKQIPMRSWPKAVLDIFFADSTITGTDAWLKWLKQKVKVG